jgi:hypothetical protein
MDIIASMVLPYSSLKFTDILLFTMYLVLCMQTAKIDFFDPEGSSPFTAYQNVLYMKVFFGAG